MKNLVKTIQNIAFQHELWKRGNKIVIGVSGGPDSVCLLDVLAKIAPKTGLQLIIAHVNYGLRGKNSAADEKFVRKLAEKYALPIEVLPKVQPSESRRSNLRSVSENELRNVRYDFFEKIREKNKFDSVAVAHNSDDQVETFLMRVIRGSGLQGLSGMKFKNGRIIRPLLNVSREEILEHLDRTNKTYRTDRTNATDLFFRNKVRNRLIPYLEKNYNPRIKKTILASIASIADDQSLLDEMAEKVYRTNRTDMTNATGIIFSAKKILELHPALQRRVLLLYIRKRKGDLQNIESSHIEEILKALRSTKGKNQVVVFAGLKMTKKNDRVILV
jgi:tRNA(Ile)-lysidine synthase